ncbi:MAG: molybdate ABC transporter substrate-binding protein [Pseudomonadota bacterium]
MLPLRLISVVLCWALAGPAQAEGVTVFAAASLKTALDAVLEESPPGADVTVSYAATSTIARQIALGAPADLVITASSDWMTYLEGQNRVVPQSRVDLLGNELVLVARADMMFIALANMGVDDFVGKDRLAMALVEAVPAGIYGQEALTALGLWTRLAPQVVQTDNVRAALRLVAMKEAPFGIVYATDALAEPRVQVVYRFAPDLHGPIRYPMALVSGDAAARALWAHLQSDTAAAIFARHGFTPLAGPQ